jgi:protein arginine kinase activator
MQCQKCAKLAVVHLTEIVTDQSSLSNKKTTVEIHLCLDHAVAAGLLTPLSDSPSHTVSIQPLSSNKGQLDSPAAIVPTVNEETGLTLAREGPLETCPVCGMTWGQFRQGGLLGCGHDYDLFAPRLLPLLKRTQEGAVEHVGKIPPRKKREEGDRQVVTLRLRRELQKAIDAENYEQAAQVRDQLRSLEKN